jgi:hypothetical protein
MPEIVVKFTDPGLIKERSRVSVTQGSYNAREIYRAIAVKKAIRNGDEYFEAKLERFQW